MSSIVRILLLGQVKDKNIGLMKVVASRKMENCDLLYFMLKIWMEIYVFKFGDTITKQLNRNIILIFSGQKQGYDIAGFKLHCS